jgi:hypothetical protein
VWCQPMEAVVHVVSGGGGHGRPMPLVGSQASFDETHAPQAFVPSLRSSELSGAERNRFSTVRPMFDGAW